MEKTFKELYLSGEVEFEEIDDYVDRWQRSDDERRLAQFMGFNLEEETAWVEVSEDALRELLDAQKK